MKIIILIKILRFNCFIFVLNVQSSIFSIPNNYTKLLANSFRNKENNIVQLKKK